MTLTEQLFDLLLSEKAFDRLPENRDDEHAFLSFLLNRMRSSNAQLFQDLWVLFRSGSKRNGFFVEFGASDGLKLSNTYLLETCFFWRGIVAEADPRFHETLRRNRRCAVSTHCVAERSGETAQFVQAGDPFFSTMQDYKASDHHATAREGGSTISVATISLLDLLRSENAPQEIDYLSIDTEGSEFDILRAFDFGKYNIKLITVEHNYTPRRDDIYRLLSAHGYIREFAGRTRWEDWYIKPQ
jgi:FkbM family methyltransferase